MPQLKAQRAYDMANRLRQAADTHSRIVEAAGRLFQRDGYTATTIAAIAAEAGVAVQTIYASAKSKRDILQGVIDLAVRGADDRDVPIQANARWREIKSEPDPRTKLRRFARLHREICEREVYVFRIMSEAAATDPEIKALLLDGAEKRYSDHKDFARSLQRQSQIRRELSVRRASDVIWTLANETTYLDLVQRRGWTPEEYEQWLADQLIGTLLPRPSNH
jgi:TetR/AcrR family transcriptional regulator, regulator of autoinduction and epiphytic fitness